MRYVIDYRNRNTDGSALSAVTSYDRAAEEPNYVIHQGKVIDLSKLNIDEIRKEIDANPYKALEIDDLRVFIEKALEQLINKNCTRIAFSQRYKNIISCHLTKTCRKAMTAWHSMTRPTYC